MLRCCITYLLAVPPSSPLSGRWSRYQDFGLFVGLLLWLGVFQVRGLDPPASPWPAFGAALWRLAPVQLPGLLFAWYKARRHPAAPDRRYWRWWGVCFGVGLPLLTWVCVGLHAGTGAARLLIIGAGSSLLLELLLVANAYYRRRVPHSPWLQKIGFAQALFSCLVLLAAVLAAMAVSSLPHPAYYTERGELLIGFEFSPRLLVKHFGTFLSFGGQFLLMYLSGYGLFYLNSRWLVPRVLQPHGLLRYGLMVLAAVAVLYPVLGQLLAWLPAKQVFGNMLPSNPFRLENAGAALVIMLLSLPVVLALQASQQTSRILALEREQAQTELELLRQQLNPHFFFNTLNNLYALSLQQAQQTPESILRLAELMRYVIYRGQQPQVAVQEEVKHIEDYVALQLLRRRQKLHFRFTQDLAEAPPLIAPLLLIVLVENAFKHGIEPAEDEAYLHLELRWAAGRLSFRCENSVEVTAGGATGIGLRNLRRRLALLYPARHTLTTGRHGATFTAELALDLA